MTNQFLQTLKEKNMRIYQKGFLAGMIAAIVIEGIVLYFVNKI